MIVALPTQTLATARAYPSPFRPGHGASGITFDQLPAETPIRIYSMDGRSLKALMTDSSGRVEWDVTNNDGRAVSSGVYVVVMEKDGERKFIKIIVQK